MKSDTIFSQGKDLNYNINFNKHAVQYQQFNRKIRKDTTIKFLRLKYFLRAVEYYSAEWNLLSDH